MSTRYFENKAASSIRLFCLPHAGGSAEFFLSWKKFIPEYMDLCPIQLPGRSYLIEEKLQPTIQQVADECVKLINQYSDKKIALYGHSMGSILAYEIALKLDFRPSLVCLSGGDAPHMWKNKKIYTHFSDKELLQWMMNNYNYSGSESKLAKSFLMPFIRVLREDLKICENYQSSEKILDCPVVILGAKDDNLCTTDLSLWRKYCPQAVINYFKNGGHFFHRMYANEIISIMENTLKQTSE